MIIYWLMQYFGYVTYFAQFWKNNFQWLKVKIIASELFS